MKNTTALPASLAAFRTSLLDWFHREARDLPWRATRDPYHVWLSEIILQQTRVDQGLPYYHRFLNALPTLQSLAAASEDTVLKLWEGLGYYTRARNLHKTAKRLVEQHNGQFPSDPNLLQLLPGIGPYTAGAISSIAFNIPAPILDGNVKRVLARLFNIEQSIDRPDTQKQLWDTAAQLTPQTDPGDFNQGMMELGARICAPKKPRCHECPVAKHCRAYALGLQEMRPVRTPKKTVPHKEIVVAAIRRDRAYLIGRRPTEGLLGGLWELPGGKVEPGESHQAALRRECLEELALTVRVHGLIASVNHAYTHFRVTLSVYRCSILSGDPIPKTHTELRWVPPSQFPQFPFPKANHKFLPLLD